MKVTMKKNLKIPRVPGNYLFRFDTTSPNWILRLSKVNITIVYRVWVKDSNLRNEPKFVVFLSQLLLLFKFCHHCKADNALVEARQHGTMIIVSTSCINPHCQKKETVWRSQPTMSGTVVAAGNFLLCFAILLAGGSASKVFQIFDHMGLACISLKTFFKHQRVCIL